MTDLRARRKSASPFRRALAVAEAAPAVAVVLLIFFFIFYGQSLSRTARDLCFLAFGLFFAWGTLANLRRGEIPAPREPYVAPGLEYARSSDPAGFWGTIALYAAMAVGALVGSVGDLLRWWNLSDLWKWLGR